MNILNELKKSKAFYGPIADILHSIDNNIREIRSATDEDDMHNCTDLYAFYHDLDIIDHIAVRLRSSKYVSFQDQITIRSQSQHNGKSEYDKLFVDFIPLKYYFLGFYNNQKTDLLAYKLIDWHKFIEIYKKEYDDMLICKEIYEEKNKSITNPNDNTKFIIIKLVRFSDSIVGHKKYTPY